MDRRELMAVSRALDRLPVDQRKAALRALRQVTGKAPLVLRVRAFEAIGDLIRAQARTNDRRKSDAKTDATRRTLVGARVPRADADRYRAAAAAEELSLYAWTVAALNAHADRMSDDATRRRRRKRQDREQQPRRYQTPRRGT